MNRDYDIGRFTTNSFYGNIMSKEELAEILTYFNISVFNVDGSQRKTADLIRDLKDAIKARENAERELFGEFAFNNSRGGGSL